MLNGIPSENKKWKAHDTIYAGALAVLFAMSLFMFYRQTIRYNGGYPADTSLYVDMSLEGHGLRLIKWIFHYLQAAAGNTVLIAVFMGLVVLCTALANYALFRWYQTRDGAAGEWQSRAYAEAASLIMFVTGSMYLPVLHPRFYKGSWCTYAWHSPTQMLMILFAMLTLLIFLKIYENYMERISPAMWILLMFTSVISVWSKPSFMLVFIPTVIVVFVIELTAHAKDGETARRFGRLFIFGLSMVPSGLLILFLNSNIYGSTSENKVAMQVAGSDAIGYNVYAAAFCGLLFPAIVFLVNYRRLRELPFQIALSMLLFGIAEWYVFHEVGTRGEHGNFGWGRQFGCYYFFFCAFALTWSNLRDKDFMAGKPALRKAYFIILGVILAMHVLSQTYHLYLMFRGHTYYI